MNRDNSYTNIIQFLHLCMYGWTTLKEELVVVESIQKGKEPWWNEMQTGLSNREKGDTEYKGLLLLSCEPSQFLGAAKITFGHPRNNTTNNF